MQTVTVDRNTQHLAFLAGELQAAKDDLGRAMRNGTSHEVNVARAEVEAAQRDFTMEFKAVKVLQELAAPVVSVPVTMQAAKKNERCPHWKLIKRFFAIAREAGLDTSAAAKPRMRHALESAMGRYVDSRGEVTANEWMMLGDRVKAGLSW
jgi:hypothetical protein